MQKLRTALLSALVGAFAVGTASAATKTLTIDLADLVENGANAIFDPAFGIMMNDVGDSQVGIHFTLPANYKKNSPVIIRLQMLAASPSCNVMFVPSLMIRQHKASAYALTNGMASVPAGLTTIAMPATATTLVTRDFKMKKPTLSVPAGFVGQKAGDLILATFERDPLDASDTCAGQLVIRGARVIYQTP